MPPLIVTAALDDDSFAKLSALRRQHFPPERNLLNAHLTLFHALPIERLQELSNLLERAAQAPFPLRFEGLRNLGRGVAIEVHSPELQEVHALLAKSFADTLTAQDRQPFRPHVTIMNKSTPDAARLLLQQPIASWTGTAAGLEIHDYLGGPWQLLSSHRFLMRQDAL